MAVNELTGACLCGAVRFKVKPPFGGFRYCTAAAVARQAAVRMRRTFFSPKHSSNGSPAKPR